MDYPPPSPKFRMFIDYFLLDLLLTCALFQMNSRKRGAPPDALDIPTGKKVSLESACVRASLFSIIQAKEDGKEEKKDPEEKKETVLPDDRGALLDIAFGSKWRYRLSEYREHLVKGRLSVAKAIELKYFDTEKGVGTCVVPSLEPFGRYSSSELKRHYRDLMDLAVRTNPTGCLILPVKGKTGGYAYQLNKKGYLQMGSTCEGLGRFTPSHLVWWVHKRQTIQPARTNISHLCHQRLCINIDHLVLEGATYNVSRNYCATTLEVDGREISVCTHRPKCLVRSPEFGKIDTSR